MKDSEKTLGDLFKDMKDIFDDRDSYEKDFNKATFISKEDEDYEEKALKLADELAHDMLGLMVTERVKLERTGLVNHKDIDNKFLLSVEFDNGYELVSGVGFDNQKEAAYFLGLAVYKQSVTMKQIELYAHKLIQELYNPEGTRFDEQAFHEAKDEEIEDVRIDYLKWRL